MHVHIFESLQLEDLYVGALLHVYLKQFAVYLKLTHYKLTIL